MVSMKGNLAFLIFTLTFNSVLSGYYDYNHEPKTKIIYTPILPVVKVKVQENLSSKYFELFLSNPYAAAVQNLEASNRFSVNLTQISDKCPRDSFFASYNPSHGSAVSSLSRLYGDQTEFNSLLNLGQFFKTQTEVHPEVWYSSFIRGQMSTMPETLSMARPSPVNLFPTSFFPQPLLQEVTPSPGTCVLLDERFGADNGIENALWYFREDVQMNVHHWIWHLLYPLTTPSPIPRRGEFFYFFHHELIARYEAERLSNGLPLQLPFNMQINSIVEEGYNPHLMNGISTQIWAQRPPFQNLAIALNDTIFGELQNLTISRDRVVESLLAGTVFNGFQNIPIHTMDNVNIVGELTEGSSIHSINPLFYGMDGFHNNGHFIFANLIGDSPQGTMGVMGDVATAMRDPIFYRWHKLVDLLFLGYKGTHLAPYQLLTGQHPLVFDGAKVTSVHVIPQDTIGGTVNLLRTFWNSRRWNLEGGLDFNSMGTTQPPNVNVCAKHLDHEEFQYHIQIENKRATPIPVTVRIFMAPRFRSLHEKHRYTMSEQRIRFFSMDSFVTTIQPGSNLVRRRSVDSTLTAPFPRSIEQIRRDIANNVTATTDCECGYPHHLLLPKGSENGMTFDIFVMVTDGTVDQVVDPPRSTPQQNFTIPQCTPAHIHCGIQGRNYPDSRPMGYPFDRRPFLVPTLFKHPSGKLITKYLPVQSLEEYVSHIPNTATTKIVILHQNTQLGLQGLVQINNVLKK